MILVWRQVESLGEVRERLSRVGMSEGRAQEEVRGRAGAELTEEVSSLTAALEISSLGSVFNDSFEFLSACFSINFIKFSS